MRDLIRDFVNYGASSTLIDKKHYMET